MSSDQAGDSKEPMPSSSGGSSSGGGDGDEGIVAKILDAIKNLLSGGQGNANAMGPGLVQRHTDQLNAYGSPDQLNPQGTPMPTPAPTPQPMTGPIQSQPAPTPMTMRPSMGAPTAGGPGMGGIPPQMQLAMARQRMQPQMGGQPEDMSKYQKPIGRG